jgi:hypothetical protein
MIHTDKLTRTFVVRMIGLTGFRKPTFGPRITIQDHRRH